jgi:hypothetical protein
VRSPTRWGQGQTSSSLLVASVSTPNEPPYASERLGQAHRKDDHMPTDVDRQAQVLQNVAVGIGAIREAIEWAFGVTLPTAATLNAEFEIITSAIYAAADQPRPVPLTDNKLTTRTHFVYRIDIWTDDGKYLLEQRLEPRASIRLAAHSASKNQTNNGRL